MTPADLALLAAGAAIVAVPLAAGRFGRAGTRCSLAGISALLPINLYLGWTAGPTPADGVLEGQATAFALIAATVLFLLGLVAVAASTLALKWGGAQSGAGRVGE
ncbi:hypothetical protein [Sphingomonas flavalba]|uniref:hypothetical protein n=1 Tax=Sphingomonas flavalba TaxID=2559804 RepID=UPI00109E074E|nr:hypothetical protein [Sphingomonas flavalba]